MERVELVCEVGLCGALASIVLTGCVFPIFILLYRCCMGDAFGYSDC